jgi:ribosome-associated toxin RatA of RatAB toxin-antitoxin module
VRCRPLVPAEAGERRDDVEEQVTERMVIRGTPDHCYSVLTQFERYPEWAADIKAVRIDERDERGRAVRVTFRAAAFGRSTSYTLLYDYADAPHELSWIQVDGDLTRRLDGAYVLEPYGADATEIRYDLVVDLKVPLPGFVKRRAEGRIMGTALRELRARVEGDPAPGAAESGGATGAEVGGPAPGPAGAGGESGGGIPAGADPPVEVGDGDAERRSGPATSDGESGPAPTVEPDVTGGSRPSAC